MICAFILKLRAMKLKSAFFFFEVRLFIERTDGIRSC